MTLASRLQLIVAVFGLDRFDVVTAGGVSVSEKGREGRECMTSVTNENHIYSHEDVGRGHRITPPPPPPSAPNLAPLVLNGTGPAAAALPPPAPPLSARSLLARIAKEQEGG